MNLPSIPLPSTGWLLLAAGLAGATAAWTVQGWRYGAQLSDIKLEASEKALDSVLAAKGKTDRMRVAAADLDAQKTKELKDEKAKYQRERDSVANGTGRLQLNASCAKLPGLTDSASVGDGTTARLTDTAERNYWLLKDRAITCIKQVEALQGVLRVERLAE